MFSKGQLSVYFHWPFCLSKCPYCDFNVHVRDDIDVERFEAAYLKSLEYYKYLMPERIVGSVYFGGGTPSLMPADMVGRILDKVRELWPSANDLEVTLEANPTSIEAEKFQAFKDVGVSRVSIGVQALNDDDLTFLGRQHSRNEAIKALVIAGDVFERFSFDLIYARPEQTLKNWEEELVFAQNLAKGHMSLYQLTIERNTPFYFDHQQRKFNIPEQELAADFYILTQELMAQAGLPFYEVSNHATSEAEQSRHNLQYWHSGEYIGIGPGAHGRIDIDGGRHATRDHYAPESWLEWVEEKGCGAHPFEKLSAEDRVLEQVMMGLRLVDGLEISALTDPRLLNFEKLGVLADQGWLNYDDKRIQLSVEGMLRLNAIVPFILQEETALQQIAR